MANESRILNLRPLGNLYGLEQAPVVSLTWPWTPWGGRRYLHWLSHGLFNYQINNIFGACLIVIAFF